MYLLLRKIRLVSSAVLAREEGQDLVEYAMILALLSLGATAGVGSVGTAVAGIFDKLASIIVIALR